MSTRIVPTVMAMLKNLAEQGNRPPTTAGAHANPPPLAANSYKGSVSSGLSSTGSSHITSNENGSEHSSSSKDD